LVLDGEETTSMNTDTENTAKPTSSKFDIALQKAKRAVALRAEITNLDRLLGLLLG
jgi:DNA-directed RNA polymerase subunit K/omega